MAVSWVWRIEFHDDEEGGIFDFDEVKDYSEAVRLGEARVARGEAHSYEIPLVRTVWNHNDGITDEEYTYPPFAEHQQSYLPKKYVAQYNKEVTP